MKKILCLLLVLALVLCSCADAVDTTSTDSAEISSVESLELSSAASSEASSEPISSKETSSADTVSEVQTRGNIQITMENWETYFEFAVIPRFATNAFGEVEKLQFAHLLKLKDEYAKKVDTSKTKMTIEVSFVYGERSCEVDLANQAYVLGDYAWTERETQTQQTLWHCGVHGFDVYGFEVGKYYYISEVANGKFCSYSDFELLRVQGSLYLK